MKNLSSDSLIKQRERISALLDEMNNYSLDDSELLDVFDELTIVLAHQQFGKFNSNLG